MNTTSQPHITNQRKFYSGSWRGKKIVRERNPEQFVTDFYGVRTIMAACPKSFSFIEVKRASVWERAKEHKIVYQMRNDILQTGRTVMLIL